MPCLQHGLDEIEPTDNDFFYMQKKHAVRCDVRYSSAEGWKPDRVISVQEALQLFYS